MSLRLSRRDDGDEMVIELRIPHRIISQVQLDAFDRAQMEQEPTSIADALMDLQTFVFRAEQQGLCAAGGTEPEAGA